MTTARCSFCGHKRHDTLVFTSETFGVSEQKVVEVAGIALEISANPPMICDYCILIMLEKLSQSYSTNYTQSVFDEFREKVKDLLKKWPWRKTPQNTISK
jgi:hypothetical protein